MPDNQDYYIIYGFGYAKYIHTSNNLIQNLTMYVPTNDAVKVNILCLKNMLPRKRKVKIVYYAKLVLDEDEIKSDKYINLEYKEKSNIIIARNLINEDFTGNVYVSSSEKIRSYTGNKNFFLGNGGISNPDALGKVSLNNEVEFGKNSIIAVELEVVLEAFETKEISIILGEEEKQIECLDKAYKYTKINNCMLELENVKKMWRNTLEKIQVTTQVESNNIILNGWALYQNISSRVFAKSGFYQSGGATGFRDQLQDMIAVKYVNEEMVKKQIIEQAKHQFIEGDVEHWWHDDIKRGIRTKFSDDLLWLPFVTADFVKFTNDFEILDIQVSYLGGEVLQDGIDERYDIYEEIDVKESIYKHCIRAIEHSLNFGENGLPKIGSGDWNDGFSTVGNKGKGESVWLGFFMYAVLDNFIPICEYKNDLETVEKYRKVMLNLKKALNSNGWDGRWFKRAFMDDGNILGSMQNEECRIDSISQSWSIISNAGDNDKKYIALESLENHLVDREIGIIKLLDPPFEKSKLEPGYIKAYVPGTRENGGQYTHASCWAIIAESILGFGDKAVELFRMINPIEHARTKDACNKYKVEPYVIAADIYGESNLAGRGGWTWYTGSCSWMYEAGIKYILGLRIENGYLQIKPCIANNWKEYQIRYKYKDSIYNITVKNPNGKTSSVSKFIVNSNEIIEKKIKLDGSSNIYNIEVILG